MGSSIEYGHFRSPHRENFFCKPKFVKSVYGKAKLLSTIYLIKLFKKKRFPATILRLYLSYGPKQDENRFLPIIIKSCIKDKTFACSEGNQLRDFVHVNDVVDAIMKSIKIKKARGEIINIGSGKPLKLKKIINYVSTTLNGGKPEFGKIKLRKDEILKMYPNIKKARKKIQWKPKILFKKGILQTIRYYKNDSR